MNKNNFKTITLAKGEIQIYDFGKIKLHAYKTNDFLNNETFIVEKNGKSIIIEPPCFYDNIAELQEHVKTLNVKAMLVSYHAAGGTFLPNIPKYATKNAINYGEQGGGKTLINNFEQAFGNLFDNSIHKMQAIEQGNVTLDGIDFVLTENSDAYTIEIPEINSIYIHMLGNDVHSIVANAEHANALIDELKGYIVKDYNLLLTSHYTPEDMTDVKTKIDYLEKLKQIANNCPTAEEFKATMKNTFPNYSGENYLDMTANMFYAK